MPAMPYLGMYLTDLTFVTDGNQLHVLMLEGEECVNFHRCTRMARIFSHIERFQGTLYNYTPLPVVQQFLRMKRVLTDEECYAESLRLEPRAGVIVAQMEE